jgi:hypothetical protein
MPSSNYIPQCRVRARFVRSPRCLQREREPEPKALFRAVVRHRIAPSYARIAGIVRQQSSVRSWDPGLGSPEALIKDQADPAGARSRRTLEAHATIAALGVTLNTSH